MARSASSKRSERPAARMSAGIARMEPVEEILKAHGERPAATGSPDDTAVFRPLRRPLMAYLCILDDGSEDGEWIRLCNDKTVLGRNDGDILFGDDSMVSNRHAEIARVNEGGRQSWYLTDLDSTNGTYVRVSEALLRDGQELLLGSRRYRF